MPGDGEEINVILHHHREKLNSQQQQGLLPLYEMNLSLIESDKFYFKSPSMVFRITHLCMKPEIARNRLPHTGYLAQLGRPIHKETRTSKKY